ncbi:MAG: hypothetical protein K8R36_09855 [Planctomycetales bacterium]|nr:hypothetical protein [Planctomycetales bacterium]
MNSLKLAVGILVVIVASKTCSLAMAQAVEPPTEASVRPDNPYRVYLTDAHGENSTASSPSQQEFSSPSNTEFQDDCYDGCFRPFCNDPCPCVYVSVAALYMQQVPRFSHQPIVVDPNTNTTFLSTSDLNSNFSPGLQATAGMRLRNGRAVEFDYFGLFGGSTSAVAVKPDPNAFLTFPNNLARVLRRRLLR